jgi:hypothetical protein
MEIETCGFSESNIEQNFEEMSVAFDVGDLDKMSECMTFASEAIKYWRTMFHLRANDYNELIGAGVDGEYIEPAKVIAARKNLLPIKNGKVLLDANLQLHGEQDLYGKPNTPERAEKSTAWYRERL